VEPGMRFRVLGPLWVANEDREVTPTAPKVRQVLAFLLVRAGRLVQVPELIDELWGDEPPNSAMTTLQTYIYKLRKDVLENCSTACLHTRASGYQLDVPAECGDLLPFERLAQEGRDALEAGDPATAAERLSAALDLWRGPALADVAVGDVLSAHVTRLEEERLQVLDQRLTADLQLGRHMQLVSELKMLVSEHPLNERFHAHLMTALHRWGRRHEGLDVYQGLRRRLVDELGMEPSASVQRIHVSLLNSDSSPGSHAPASVATAPQRPAKPQRPAVPQPPAASQPSAAVSRPGPDPVRRAPSGPVPDHIPGRLVSAAASSAPPATVVARRDPAPVRRPIRTRGTLQTSIPSQLPPDVDGFVGRTEELEAIGMPCPMVGETAGGVVCVSGMPGVGKSALVARAAHEHRSTFSDGQLYADMGATSDRPAEPYEVLGAFLSEIGVPPQMMPDSVQERSKLFRTWSADRRVLIVLDDVASASQVEPLLPSSRTSLVITAGRRGLYSLSGVRHVELDPLAPVEAVELVERASGRRFTGHERAVVERAAGLCGHLPLALESLGARLATMGGRSIERLAAKLEEPGEPLSLLTFAGFDPRARIASSYQRLGPRDASTFRLISLLPPAGFTVDTAARLVGTEPEWMETRLARLVRDNLVSVVAGGPDLRYRMHELVRLYARERLDLEFQKLVREEGPAREIAFVGDGGRHEEERGHRDPDLQVLCGGRTDAVPVASKPVRALGAG
jgi:DNA-binding SARP family transcriptional activator